MIKVELVYVGYDKNVLHFQLEVAPGTTALEALESSKLYETLPETKDLSFGIYAKKIDAHTVLKDGDRLELYRPLTLDPKEKRRLLAKAKPRKK